VGIGTPGLEEGSVVGFVTVEEVGPAGAGDAEELPAPSGLDICAEVVVVEKSNLEGAADAGLLVSEEGVELDKGELAVELEGSVKIDDGTEEGDESGGDVVVVEVGGNAEAGRLSKQISRPTEVVSNQAGFTTHRKLTL
jgi:hypothetical protein